MQFTALQATANVKEKCVHINTIQVDETELIYNDPEEVARIRSYGLFNDEELDESFIQEPHSKIIGGGYFIHARLISHAACRAFREVFTDLDIQQQVADIEASVMQHSFECDDATWILTNSSRDGLAIRTIEDLKMFINAVLKGTTY